MTDFMHIFVAGIALFLVGSNIAFLAHLGDRLVKWFMVRIIGGSLILLYVASSAFYGNPTPIRLSLGVVAVIVDMAALFLMWQTINEQAASGVTGLVPLIRPEKNEQVH